MYWQSQLFSIPLFLDFQTATLESTTKLTHSQPQILSIIARLEPWPSNQRLADTTVITAAIVGRYVGLEWKVRFIQAEVT